MSEEGNAAAKSRLLHRLEMLSSAPSILLPLVAMHEGDQWGTCVSCSLLSADSSDVVWPCPTIELIVDLVDILQRGDVHLLPQGFAPMAAARTDKKFEITTVEGDHVTVVPLFREQIAVSFNSGYVTITKNEAKEISHALARVS